ncbi:hypothetical protein [Oceanobacillus bengalensis]|uniref:Uncharacterized protein n=1 Tax=Oceanobacillus bengalensis TaxID=1435466 RepID=A0A494Z3H5_9BACI|nr:hypothetical protein [Oceanobacillus bengalensis]RKQ17067.1 hypothetical protein D8M05_05190 [Oceanobacillus bengalensis]
MNTTVDERSKAILIEFEREVEAFNERKERIPLTEAARNLMYALLLMRCEVGWLDNFQAHNHVLRNLSRLPQAELENARFELQAYGFICFLMNGEETAIYQLITFVD